MAASDKASQGERLAIPAVAWNRMVDVADWWQEQQRLGAGGGGAQVAADLATVKVQNDSGADRRRGEVLEITSSSLLDDDQLDALHLWFRGDTPARAGRTFGVLRDPVPDGEIGRLQLAGIVLALVDVQETTHTRAMLVPDSEVLESCEAGPIQIVYKPTGTGELTCAVLLGVGCVQLGKLDAQLSKDGSANATRWQRNAGDTAWEATSPTVTDKVYDWLLGTGETVSSGKKVIYAPTDSGKWLLIAAECE